MTLKNPIDDVLEAMATYGGSFVQNLVRLYRSADANNRALIISAFWQWFEMYDGLISKQGLRDRDGD